MPGEQSTVPESLQPRFGRFRFLVAALALGLLDSFVPSAPPFARDAFASSGDLEKLLVVSPDTVQQTATYEAISKLPASDDGVVVPWLRDNVDRLQPMFLYELARRVFPADHDLGLEWYALAQMRARYDARKCADASAQNGVELLAQRAEPIPEYVRAHQEDLAAAFERALQRPDLFVDRISPRWICVHGLRFAGQQSSKPQSSPSLKPATEWPAIRRQIRQEIANAESFRAPKASSSAKFSLRQIPVDGEALSIAWSPNGRLLATSSKSYTHIAIWDVQTGKPLQQLERNVAFGESLAFTPDGRYLLTPTARRRTREEQDAAVSIWDVTSGKVVKNIPGPHPGKGINENRAESFSLDARGRILAIMYHSESPRQIGVYYTRDWSLIRLVTIDRELPSSVAVSPNGKWLAVGTARGRIVIYDTSNWTVVQDIDAYRGFSASVTSLAFSPDSRSLACAPQTGVWRPGHPVEPIPDSIRIWNVNNGTLSLSLPLKLGLEFGNQVREIAWNSDGRLIASASDDHSIRLWNLSAPHSPTTIARYSHAAWAVGFSPDGRQLAAAGESMVIIANILR